MERFYILAPAVAATGYFLAMFAVYCVLCWTGRAPQVGNLKTNEVFGAFLTRYIIWLLSPVERVLVRSHVSPNIITGVSLAACAGGGVALALGHLATAAWLYILGGLLDIVDGRLARATGRQTQAGALFDSVADRWAELAFFAGYTWYLRETLWLLAAFGASGASLMVSYTRARGEGLGLELKVGAMQRAERIVLVAVGTLAAAWLGASPSSRDWMIPAAGIALTVCAVLSAWTAVGRWIEGYHMLLAKQAPAGNGERRREREPEVAVPVVRVDRAAEAAMRITGEHTA